MSGGRSHHDQRKKKKSSTLSDGAVLTDSHRSRVSLNWWFFFFMINFLILFFSLSLYCLLTKIKLSCFHQLQVCWFMGVNVLNKIKKSRWRKAESRKQDCVPFFSLPFDNEYCCTFLGGGGGSGNLSRFERCWFTFFFFFFWDVRSDLSCGNNQRFDVAVCYLLWGVNTMQLHRSSFTFLSVHIFFFFFPSCIPRSCEVHVAVVRSLSLSLDHMAVWGLGFMLCVCLCERIVACWFRVHGTV